MDPLDAYVGAEAHVRRLLEAQDLPPPDDVEYRDGEIVLLWHGPKVAVVVELTDD